MNRVSKTCIILSYHLIFDVKALIFTPSYRATKSIQVQNDELAFLLVRRVATCRARKPKEFLVRMSDWSGFDDTYDDDSEDSLTQIDFAGEHDTQEHKAAVGEMLAGPEVYSDVEPLFVPQGNIVPLNEQNVERILAACREEIGTLFGYSAENRGVGITGGVDFVELDGPIVVLRLKGRFWHQRPTVLARVGAYLQGRIPEIIEVTIEDPYQLTDEANREAE